jgi:predicted metalloprotease
MRWRTRRQSEHIEDRRGTRMSRAGVGGGLGLLVMVLMALLFGVDPGMLLQEMTATDRQRAQPPSSQPADGADEGREFVAVVLADTEDVWHDLFGQMGRRYREPTLVLFTGSVRSACGFAQAAVGPFYCPADGKVYIDLSFYDELRGRYGAPGDFAQAYVIAHEVGHHVQRLLGTSEHVATLRQQADPQEANRLSVRLELQADCFAGVWANHADRAKHILEVGDVEEALNAASAVGDDRLQQRSRGYVSPESFTHGSAAERVRWFRKGLESGDVAGCDTFGASSL